MLKYNSKKRERIEKFKKIGAAISALKTGDPDARDYHTGGQSSFHLKRGDAKQREEENASGTLCFWPRRRVTTPYGPQFKTPQWLRTVKV